MIMLTLDAITLLKTYVSGKPEQWHLNLLVLPIWITTTHPWRV